MFFPSAETAVKAIFRPSGEMTAASDCVSLKASSGGGVNDSRTGRVSDEGRLKYITPSASAAINTAAAATSHASRAWSKSRDLAGKLSVGNAVTVSSREPEGVVSVVSAK